jgi:hypothetical protein
MQSNKHLINDISVLGHMTCLYAKIEVLLTSNHLWVVHVLMKACMIVASNVLQLGNL